ncbi:hypothetical protein COW36_22420 [bacterium (Candidatus Blackallbacteria) CG17_big_fil_post_rev_8_21_14_2_50_48_46]|uniref:EF-hand domain-containing protein n=1 Tax=bacterium (Candidatus Blackallbacteria) CG17_big_fil_post_rev_8_21_14_2_50_48_46 TaxID=2014261 RepID=A0A2M7FY63_9BACT|nr:MAG: hypothetical protein COW64_05745 [bacterium (Candidatus Blackallbacteria) CG18_big_fil_WC_8_21_14_2_50_49_26]PIW14227.1 MAG: hypothetical protein COW36_22420 [bacterium (Candidatus Blackallbacteria) CG17_big_fil_post_rev_8_21_14_2_50_48_46]PIW46968.1 MAG: hypothetical protein COW20_14070 [bacterium (Candidatus Blackallbacteria) CG13_big_fil_rev_8_21_14_2_50_49_14]
MSIKPFALALCLGLLFTLSAQAKPRGERFENLDLNKDGKITQLEMQMVSRERFQKADQNKDGFLVPEEVLELMPFFVRNQARKPVTEYLQKQDTNKDGKVSLDEVMAHASKRFARLDSDKNGSLSPEEFKRNAGKMEL